MTLRDGWTESVPAFLEPGEEIQAFFGAQTASPLIAALSGFLFFLGLNRYRIVVATSRRILVLNTGRFSVKTPRGIVSDLPRTTELGPGRGVWHVIPNGNEKLRVHRRQFQDLARADALRFGDDLAPE